MHVVLTSCEYLDIAPGLNDLFSFLGSYFSHLCASYFSSSLSTWAVFSQWRIAFLRQNYAASNDFKAPVNNREIIENSNEKFIIWPTCCHSCRPHKLRSYYHYQTCSFISFRPCVRYFQTQNILKSDQWYRHKLFVRQTSHCLFM